MTSPEQEVDEHRLESTIYIGALLGHRRSGRLVLVRNGEGHWALPSGALRLGEDIVGGLLRELQEETGIEKKYFTEGEFGHNIPTPLPLQVRHEERFLLGLVFPCDLRINLGRDKIRGWPVTDPGGDINWAKPFDIKGIMELVDEAEQLLAYPYFNSPALMAYLTIVYNNAVDIYYNGIANEIQIPLVRKKQSLGVWLLNKCEKHFPGLSMVPPLCAGFPMFRYNLQNLSPLPTYSIWGV